MVIGRWRRPPSSPGRARPPTPVARPAPGAVVTAVVAVLFLSLSLGACGDDEEPELTFEDRLELLENRRLTPAEVAERAEVGEALCRLDDAILDGIWIKLDDDQLAFQDIVFASLCPERAILYAGHTGRYVTEEAELSGVVTSTSRPTTTSESTTTTSRIGGARPTTTNSTPVDSTGSTTAATAITSTSAKTSVTRTTLPTETITPSS